MTWKASGPGRSANPPAPNTEPYANRTANAAKGKESTCEQRLVAAAWHDPTELAPVADAYGLHADDFGDRLCGVAVGYLRHCGENGRSPTLADAEVALSAFAVPRDPGELGSIIQNASAPHGCEFADLVTDVLRGSEQRSAQQLRELTSDALRALKHTFECPRCIACANGSAWTGARHGTVWETPSAAGKAVRCA